jgi:DNA-binding CsgD family transcriptional regulator
LIPIAWWAIGLFRAEDRPQRVFLESADKPVGWPVDPELSASAIICRRCVASRPMLSSDPGLLLRGRRDECDALDRLLESVQAGQSQVLVLRGEAGVGKSALLEYLVQRASGCRLARAAGVEYEMELAYAGLHQLCAPMLDLRERLPGPQCDALATAFGLSAEPAPDRFVVGLAVLGLLSEVAEEQPLLCVVDDAQWLDKTSALALAFVARRLLAEPVGLVFAVREPSDVRELAGLPEWVVGGLSDDDARALLGSALPGRMDERVRDRVVAESHGNPLALLELPRGLTPAELAGGFGLPDVAPLTNRLEQSFVRRLVPLPSETRRLLLLAAAEPVGDGALLWRAAGQLGLGADAATPSEAAGLIDLGARVRFRHPLVRSAVYRAAYLPHRQEAHRALAEATDPDVDPDRRAWHRAHAAGAPDEDVAAELERSASRAAARGGIAAAAAFLERAAELTPDSARRGGRALAAAQAKLDAGAPEAAHSLLATAELTPLDDLQRARSQRLRAQIAFALRRGSDAPPLLLDAAKRLASLDPELARETCLEALAAAIFAGGGVNGRDVLHVVRAAPPASQPAAAIDLLLNGLATWVTEGYAAAVPPLREALEAFRQDDGESPATNRWLWLACRIAADLWEHEIWDELAARSVRRARETGALNVLPIASSYRAGVHVHAGEYAEASALLEEASAITQATHTALLVQAKQMVAAYCGNEAEALELIEAGRRDATARGQGMALSMVECANALLLNGLGRYEEALAAGQRACAQDELSLYALALVELVEAAVRSGRPRVAATALERLGERTRASGTEWALGIEARSRALLTGGPSSEPLYEEAVERLAHDRLAPHLARAQLVYGEWLRRENRRVDAREQLRAAHDTFDRIGAEAFAERARRELLATGEKARRRADNTRGDLTAQEAQIARLAQDGLSNPEIGAQLFISPRTVQYHLHKVFRKLEITSRNQLVRLPPRRLSSA